MSDFDFDLSRTLRVKPYGAIGFLYVFNSKMRHNSALL